GRAEYELLPLRIPISDREISGPSAVLLVEPRRFGRRVIPFLPPVRAVALSFADGQIGQQKAGRVAGPPFHLRHFVGTVFALERSVCGDLAVDDEEIVRRRRGARDVKGAQPIAPIFNLADATPALRGGGRALRQLYGCRARRRPGSEGSNGWRQHGRAGTCRGDAENQNSSRQ